MIQIHTHNQVDNIVEFTNEFWVLSEGKVKKLNTSEIVFQESGFFGTIFSLNKYLVIQSFMGEFQFFLNDILSDKYLGYVNSTSRNLLLVKNDDIHYSINDGKLVENNVNISGIIIDSFNIVYKENITVFTFPEHKLKFTFPLSTLGKWKQGEVDYNYEVASFAGIYEDTLICTLNEGTILYLDINSGDIAGKSARAMCRTYMHQNKIAPNLFYGLSTYRFTAIDVNQKDKNGGVIQTVNLEPALEKIKRNDNSTTSAREINCSEITENNKLIFLTMNDVLGVFNPVTAEIEEYHFLDFENRGEMATANRDSLQTKENKIYVLGSKGTLLELESEYL